MAQVQFWHGKVLFVGGKVAMDPHCCCAKECPGCKNAPAHLRFVLASTGNCGCIIAGTKSRIWSGDPNGNYYLDQCPDEPCVWQYEGEYGDLTARTFDNMGCTGASADVPGKIYGYVEFVSDRFISEWHVRGSGGDFMDAIFINVGGGTAAAGDCDVTDYPLNTAYGECNVPSGSAYPKCQMPPETGYVAFTGGEGLITSVY